MSKAKSNRSLKNQRYFALPSKLNPPVIRSESVKRQTLLDALRDGQFRLALIVAGAGFGKTSLLRQWYAEEQQAERKVAWLSLDENDSDPLQFISCLIASLSNIGFKLESLASQISSGPDTGDVKRIVSALCYELEGEAADVVLILDDYHTVQSSEVDAIVDLLLLRLPSAFRIGISTRSRPSIALPNLKAQGELLLIDDTELRFSVQETRELFGELVDTEEYQDICSHANGWGFALQMALILLKEKQKGHRVKESFSGASEDIAHYLSDQVLSSLPDEVQAFLIDTSFLYSVCAGLADAVRARDDSVRIMEYLKPVEASFVTHDTDELWYRYHPLFSEFLQDLLSKKGESYSKELRRRAAAWYGQNEMLVEAVKQSVMAGDIELTAQIMSAAGGATILLTHGVTTISNIMNLVPKKWIHEAPVLKLGKAALLARDGKTEEAFQYIKDVKGRSHEDQLPDLTRDLLFVETYWAGYADAKLDAPLIDQIEQFTLSAAASDPWLKGWLHNALYLSHYRLGNFKKSYSAACVAMEHYIDHDTPYSQFFMHINKGMVKYVQGNLFSAYRCYRRAERLIERHFHSDKVILAVPKLLLACVFYQLNRIEKANELVQSTLPRVERYAGWPELYILGYRVAFDIAYHLNGLEKALSALTQAENTVATKNLSRLRWHILAKRIEFYCQENELEKAKKISIDEKLFEQLNLQSEAYRFAWSEQQAVAIALARLALYSNDPKRALNLLALCNPEQEAHQLQPFQLRKLLISMMAHADSGDVDKASACLGELLALSHANNLTRIYLDEGTRLSDCLKKLVNEKQLVSLPENAHTFLKNLLALQKKETISESSAVDRPFDILSVREMEILKELSYGQSNKAIARKLDISERTIKFHLQNIYAKFGVNSRTKALNIAHRYNLL